ncbi:MAG TPA: VOC family protein, partial [Candidatus Limnocylindria bacterium]|nr:VOC family protein [Candidatus Limnocylindria bacterium]
MTDPAAIASIVVVLDCADAERLADFWGPALGYPNRRAVTQFVVLS